MKSFICCGLLAALIFGAYCCCGAVVSYADTVFSVSVEGDVVRSKGRHRTRTRRDGTQVTRFRTRGITRQGGDGSCDGYDYGGCDGGYGHRGYW